MPDATPPRFHSVVLGAAEPRTLAAFYAELLGWGYRDEDDDPDWVVLKPLGADGRPDPLAPGISVQREPDHIPPVWPAGPDDQQMQAHLDLAVGSAEEMEHVAELAVRLGARLAEQQPQELVRVLQDPEGHPFCLFAPGG